MNYYLTVNGVVGDTTDAAHQKAFDLGNYTFEISRNGAVVGGSPLSVSLYSPLSIPLLLAQLKKNVKMTLTLAGRAPGASFDSLKIVFENATLIDFNTSDTGDNGAVPNTSFTFVYDRVSYTFTPATAGGKAGTPVTTNIVFG